MVGIPDTRLENERVPTGLVDKVLDRELIVAFHDMFQECWKLSLTGQASFYD